VIRLCYNTEVEPYGFRILLQGTSLKLDDLEDHITSTGIRNMKNKLAKLPLGQCFLRDLGLKSAVVDMAESVKLYVI